MLNCDSIIERYYTPGNDDYRVLVIHCRQVADLAVRLCQRLVSRTSQDIDITFVREAALLHDIGMCRTDAPGIYCHGSLPYIMHGIAGRQMLDELGLPRHALVCERHTGTGITAAEIVAQHLPIDPPRDLLPITIEEKAVCYADKFFSKSHPGEQARTMERVRQSLSRFGKDTLVRLDEMVNLFGDPATLATT